MLATFVPGHNNHRKRENMVKIGAAATILNQLSIAPNH